MASSVKGWVMAALACNDRQSLLPFTLSPPQRRGEEGSKQMEQKKREGRMGLM